MKSRWRISFHSREPRRREPPPEFLCPISNALMADPVILPSGHSFERRCIEAALSLPHQHRDLPFLCGITATLVPNIALKTAIASWCRDSGLLPPAPPSTETAESLVFKLLRASKSPENTANAQTPAAEVTTSRIQRSSDTASKSYRNVGDVFPESNVQPSRFDSPNSVLTPTDLHSSKSSNHLDRSGWGSDRSDASSARSRSSSGPVSFSPEPDSERAELVKKMRSATLSDQEEAVIRIRNWTREDREARARLCTRELLACLRSMITSRWPRLQIDAAAALVNVSLEEPNKVRIVRSGLVPDLINVLKSGHAEARGHAVGAIFSLALDDGNKTALGVLGAVPPLVHQLGASRRSQVRLEAVMALYHLSLTRGNHVRLIRAGALQKLIARARSDKLKIASRAMRILCNLANSPEGRAAMLDSSALSLIVGLVAESWQWAKDERRAELIREHCLIVTCLLARDSRFKGLAREAGAEKVIAEVAAQGRGRAKEWATKLLMTMKSSGTSAGRNQAGRGDPGSLNQSMAPSRLHERVISGLFSTF
ncbi:unnamed protein product [Victoria cruziana]